MKTVQSPEMLGAGAYRRIGRIEDAQARLLQIQGRSRLISTGEVW